MQILNLSATINVASLEPSINTYRLGEGAGTYEYPELNNKPKINGVTLVGDISSANLGIKTSDLTNDSGFISEGDIPTATSDLVNDSGFVNSTQVQSVVAGAIPSDISYFNNDVGYITDADIGNIPTRTSQLVNDSGYITEAEAPVTSVNNMTGAVVLDGTNIEYDQNVSLNSKIDAVEGSIPTQTSQLTNDSGFITNANVPTRTSQLVNDSGFVNARNIPVQSVNGETGAVELTAADIDYDSNNTVASKIDSNAQAIGVLSSLTTTHQENLVSAINEIASYTPVYGNTASGAIATFDTSLVLPLQDCTIDINAVQESGTPTPSSPKAITGFTGANIHVADDKNPHVFDNVTPITWQDEAGTVYGGSLDVTSGVLTVTHGIVDLGSLSQWNKNTSFTNTLFIANIMGKKTNNSNCICTNYTNGGIATGGTFLNNMQNNNFASDTTNGIYIRDDSKSSLSSAEFKTAMSGVYIVYELATPITYQLTPTQISAIVGTNNVFTNTNGNTSVVYACSLKDYLDGQ